LSANRKPTIAMIAATFAMFVPLLAAGCGTASSSSSFSTYPAALANAFVSDCVNRGQLPPSGCQCALSWLEQRVSAQDWATAESALAEPGWAFDDRQYAYSACATGP
jgi:hypothetical protein